MKPCTAIIGQTPEMEPEECGEPGVEIAGVVKCAKHWARSREQAERRTRKSFSADR